MEGKAPAEPRMEGELVTRNTKRVWVGLVGEGHLFELKAATETRSPLDVKGVDLGISTEEIVSIVREGRSRYGESE